MRSSTAAPDGELAHSDIHSLSGPVTRSRAARATRWSSAVTAGRCEVSQARSQRGCLGSKQSVLLEHRGESKGADTARGGGKEVPAGLNLFG